MAKARIAACILAASTALNGCAMSRYDAQNLQASISQPYLLASGDRVRVIVFGQENLSNSFSVDGAGNISMPLIGLVRAYGLTTADLSTAIGTKLRDGYLRDPRVSVEVEAFRPFFVLGEVNVSGQYPFINGMTVRNAVAVAGGFGPRAWQDGVDLTRVVGGRAVTATVPLNFVVRPGDTLAVKERFF